MNIQELGNKLMQGCTVQECSTLAGLTASARALVLSRMTGSHLLICSNEDEAQYLHADLVAFGAHAMLFPQAEKRKGHIDPAASVQRMETLTKYQVPSTEYKGCTKGEKSTQMSGEFIVTWPEAMAEPVPAPASLAANTIRVEQGQEIPISDLVAQLLELGFERQDFVFEPGQFAVRGGIVDVYSFSHEDPYRLDFFGDEIDSIRIFDIEDQLSKCKVEKANLAPAMSEGEKEATVTLDAYLEGWEKWKIEACTMYKVPSTKDVQRDKVQGTNDRPYIYHTMPQPLFHKQFDILEDDLRKKQEEGYEIYICAEQKKQLDRLQALELPFIPVEGAIHGGWVDTERKIAVYTDHEIFERYHRVRRQSENARRGKAIVTLREINQLQLGDYVVHSDHGIGQFGGLLTTSVNGKPQEMIRINFRDGDYIFVSIHNLGRISKYKGREGSAPTISKLGSSAWERLKERTKDKVKDIAKDLIRIYAKRKAQKGFAYSQDGWMQRELEASFLYEDTPDQAKATLDVKHDMESHQPMDRLICGDVGFGKTEIAMRAAMKAAGDGKQVAVMVPTTVLALQHYHTFRDRMKNFPVRIEYLSRAKTATETKEILHDLEEGKIDILVGTHKLVGKNVKWHDLGLLIIDEEQKFGVAVKDKLKEIRANVDVLTLTATPIPRTLQFSLLGARDLSVMTTPPPNRYPVQTELITMEDEDVVREAIELEMGRNGQIFVVNNRIDMLDRIAARISRLCPEARIAIAHGQMPPGEMEKVLEDFIDYEYDVLVSTTIVESGIDIPNVNTMVIYNANHYGLSDLHQLRGRVGRSNRKAYCYLVAPEKELITADAKRRLEALEIFSELGSGFNLAMQDLDIRGAGNMLGSEQSGFIADLGYETYQRILNEAVEELREESPFPADESAPLPQSASLRAGGDYNWVSDCQVDTDLSICLPSNYVENISERITLYRELDNLHCEEQLVDYQKRLIDRFGTLPEEATELMNVVRLRWLCCRMGIEKIIMKSERMALYFPQKNERYYQSDIFGRIVQYAFSRGDRCQLKEEVDKKGVKTGKRYMVVKEVRTIAGAMNLLQKINSQS